MIAGAGKRRMQKADNSPFVGFNRLPNHPGNENVPPPPDTVEATRLGVYVVKCQPDYTAIIHRARRLRKNHPLLRTVYLITNPAGESSFVEEVRKWLRSDAWNEVYAGAGDFGVNGIERAGVDVEVARRAGVFVGNGVSPRPCGIGKKSVWRSGSEVISRYERLVPAARTRS